MLTARPCFAKRLECGVSRRFRVARFEMLELRLNPGLYSCTGPKGILSCLQTKPARKLSGSSQHRRIQSAEASGTALRREQECSLSCPVHCSRWTRRPPWSGLPRPRMPSPHPRSRMRDGAGRQVFRMWHRTSSWSFAPGMAPRTSRRNTCANVSVCHSLMRRLGRNSLSNCACHRPEEQRGQQLRRADGP